MWFSPTKWLLVFSILASALQSASFAVISVASDTENPGRAFRMLPMAFQPGSPPSPLSRLLLALLGAGFVIFYGAIAGIAFAHSFLAAVSLGVPLLALTFALRPWWVRTESCRPMLPVLILSVCLISAILFAILDWALH